MKLEKVLVGVDGSPASEAAERWAAEAVKDTGGEVVAVHAVGSPLVRQAAEDAANGLGITPARLRQWEEEMQRSLEEDWCQPLRDAGVRYRAVLAHGETVHAIVHTARRENVDVIVVGHQADSGFVHRLFRGLSDNLLDQARRPVVVVSAPCRPPKAPATVVRPERTPAAVAPPR
ncbi:MAG TPA: universal stress protein [Acidimicrobiia bacterium]|nr:universal stress protein [Acidimicrobiia bacterium]